MTTSPLSSPPYWHRRALHWLFLLGLCGLIGLGGPSAQTADEPTRTVDADSDIEVRLVELDVRVTDRKGRAVEGLSVNDFVLRVDDATHPIEHFAAGRAGDGSGQGAGNADVAAAGDVVRSELPLLGGGGPELDLRARERLLIVYLDQRFLGASELVKARGALLNFLRNDLPQDTRVMLATADEELRIVQGFTHEPALVADALQGLDVGQRGGVWRMQYDLVMQEVQRYHDMGSAASAEIVTLERGGSSDEVRGGEFPLEATNNPLLGPPLEQGENKGPTELTETDPRFSLQMIESFGHTIESGLAASAAHIARLVTAASGLPGEKSVLYVGGTLPVNATKTLFELWQDTYGDLAFGGDWVANRARDQTWSSGVAAASLESGDRFSRAIERLGRVADVASASGLTFHTLDVSVPGRLGRGGGDVENYRSGAELRGGGRSNDTNLAFRSDAGANLLADRTGGRSLANRNFDNFFDGLTGDLASSYSLAFRLRPDDPAAIAADPESILHEVEVELTKEAQKRLEAQGVRGLRTHHRRKVAVRTLEQEQVERTVSALAMNLDSVNPLEIEVLAGLPRAADDGGVRVPISVKVPMSKLALVPDRQAHAGRLSIYVAVGGLDRGARLEKAVVPVRIVNRDLLTAFGRTVDYRLEVSGPAAAERLAVTVRDDFRPARSTVTTRFGTWDDAPEPTAPKPSAAPVAVPADETQSDEAEGPI